MSPTIDPVINLNDIASPFSSSTSGNQNLQQDCGKGSDQGFTAVLQPGETINIGMTWNNFDSQASLTYGGAYPGENFVRCTDDPDYFVFEWTNTLSSPQNVYYTIDAFGIGQSGAYTLEWAIGVATMSPTLPPAPVIDLSVETRSLLLQFKFILQE